MAILSILTCLGGLAAAVIAMKVIGTALIYLVPSQLRRYLHAENGKPAWALVTGASDGIGKAFSHELAGRGFNVVLHGRNPAKLEHVQSELQAAYPAREFRILVADAANCAPDVFKNIVNRLSDIYLTVLVNNAGGEASGYKILDEHTFNESTITVTVNALFPTLLLNALVPVLARNGPALILNVGSLLDRGLPLFSSYGGSKSYMRVLSESLTREMMMTGRDVTVLYLRIGQTTGVSHTHTPQTLFLPDAAKMARASLARVGCGRMVVVPYWGHALLAALMDSLPSRLADVFFCRAMTKLTEEWLSKQKKKE
jgi:17beta-estradiol 17-dehydrogenase / very-long-chain 3-oxoacyl-CoA reductase